MDNELRIPDLSASSVIQTVYGGYHEDLHHSPLLFTSDGSSPATTEVG
jgi:hypothetical protein